jgi:hypothetical protein
MNLHECVLYPLDPELAKEQAFNLALSKFQSEVRRSRHLILHVPTSSGAKEQALDPHTFQAVVRRSRHVTPSDRYVADGRTILPS